MSYFLTVAEEGNITKAANRLHIPQPHLSNSIKLIEEEYGVKLAERSTRKFSLTDAGKQFQYRASQILNLMCTTEQELQEYNSGSLGSIIVGTVTIPCPFILPKTLVDFHEMFPKVGIEVRTIRHSQVFDQLEHGLIDICLLHASKASIDNRAFEAIPLTSRPMVVVAKPSSFDNVDKSQLDLTVLKDKPLIINYRLESAVTEACNNAGFSPRYISRVDDNRTLLICASLGMGYTIMPKEWVTFAPGLDLSYFELDGKTFSTHLTLIWTKGRSLSIAAKNFLHLFLVNHSNMYP